LSYNELGILPAFQDAHGLDLELAGFSFDGGAVPERVAVFIDYQNVYRGARRAVGVHGATAGFTDSASTASRAPALSKRE
jgi:hypothetical protein